MKRVISALLFIFLIGLTVIHLSCSTEGKKDDDQSSSSVTVEESSSSSEAVASSSSNVEVSSSSSEAVASSSSNEEASSSSSEAVVSSSSNREESSSSSAVIASSSSVRNSSSSRSSSSVGLSSSSSISSSSNRSSSSIGVSSSSIGNSSSSSSLIPLTQRTFTDVKYANAHVRQVLDLKLPSSGEGRFPLLIFIHGGAFMAGDKEDIEGTAFAQAPNKGYALASIRYRLASGGTVGRFPQGVQDIMAAIRFLRANADKYHLDPERFAVSGFSAGAYYTAMITVLSTAENDIEDFTLGNADVSSAIQAAVSWSALTDLSKLDEQQALNTNITYLYTHSEPNSFVATFIGGQITLPANAPILERANPLNYINTNTPPILMQHATNDNLIPWQQSKMMVDKINEVCGAGRAEYENINNGGHGGPLFSSTANTNRIFNYLTRNWGL